MNISEHFSAPPALCSRRFHPTLSGVAAGIFLALLPVSSGSAAVELNSIAAEVNGKAITTREVNFYINPILGVLQARFPRRGPEYEKELKKARDGVLDRLIENKIVLSELERRGANIPEHVIDEEVKRIIGEMHNGNESEFRKSLAKSGMNMQGFRETQKEKILVQAFRSQQFADVPPATSSEIEAHYAKRRTDLRDRSKDTISYQKIFIRAENPDLPGSTPETQLLIADDVAAKLRAGGDFTELAMEFSDGAFPESGGLSEDESRIDLSPAFAEVIFEADINTIIGPLKDPAGFTIVKVLKKDLGPFPPLSAVSERMRQEVEIEKRGVRYRKWLDVIMRSAMIERRI